MTSPQRYGNSSNGNGRNIAVAAIATASGVVALFAYHTSPGQAEDLAGSTTPSSSTASDTAAPAAGRQQIQGGGTGNAPVDGAVPGTKGSGGTASGAAKKTYTGKPANTRWGTVQVKITVQNGQIVSASAPVSPHGAQRSVEINKYAIPILNRETTEAGSAKIDAVSGATVTSGGYVKSLQSAIDLARL